jgi:quercetin dioxygenase-like cupin family protein
MENKVIQHSEIFKFSEKIDYASTGIVSKQVIKRENGNISLFAFDAGQSLSEHSAPFDALVQVLEGEGQIIIAKKEYHVKAGEAIIMPAGIPHAVKATGAFKMLLTMIR